MAPTLNHEPERRTAFAGTCSHRPFKTGNKENAHLSLFSAFTVAPCSSSAVTLSVWPLEDARCSAVHLQGADTLTHEPNRPHSLCRRVQPPSMRLRQQVNAHLSLLAAFTSAPFSSSAFTLSVRPLLDARCSAVFLHGADTLHPRAKTARRMELEHQDRCKSAAQPLPARAAVAQPIEATNKTSRNPLHKYC